MLYNNKSTKWEKFKEKSLIKKNLKAKIKETTNFINGCDIVLNNLNSKSSNTFNSFLTTRENQRLYLEQLVAELKKQPNLIKEFLSTIKQK